MLGREIDLRWLGCFKEETSAGSILHVSLAPVIFFFFFKVQRASDMNGRSEAGLPPAAFVRNKAGPCQGARVRAQPRMNWPGKNQMAIGA